jgi:RNA polymerase sigma-70 factor, ECF subfamily
MVLSTVTEFTGTVSVIMQDSAASPSKGARNEERWRVYLDRIRARDSDALAQLYDESSSVLYGLALRVLNDPADAEEVVLDVYQQVWKSTQKFDSSRGTIWGWLTVLTRSRAIDRLRSMGTRRARELPIETGGETRSTAPAPETESIFAQERKLVRHALAGLAPEQKEAIELAFFRGLTHVEIAEAVGAPLGTIKTRIRLGMRKMRDVLAPDVSLEGNS